MWKQLSKCDLCYSLSYLFKGKKRLKRKEKEEETRSQWVLSLKWSKTIVVLTNCEKAVWMKKGKNVMSILLSLIYFYSQFSWASADHNITVKTSNNNPWSAGIQLSEVNPRPAHINWFLKSVCWNSEIQVCI